MDPRKLATIEVSAIDDTQYQTRLGIDDEPLAELVASVRRNGILVPLLVSRDCDCYCIIAGHRRYRAAVECGLETVPAQVVDAEEGIGWSGAFAENMFRQDLSVVEESAAVCDCLQSGEYTVDSLAKALGKSHGWIDDRVAIAEWPDDIQAAVHQGTISCAAARNLARITEAVHRGMLIEYAKENGATARVTAAWLQAWEAGKDYADPGEIDPLDAPEGLPAIEPYTPCVICAAKLKMVELRYLPICSTCTPILRDIARGLSQSGVGQAGG